MVKKRTIWPYLLVAPAVLIILCVVFIPVFNAIVMSFQKYDLRRPKDIAFNGVANYMKSSGTRCSGTPCGGQSYGWRQV